MTRVNWNRQLILAIGLFSLGLAAYWLEYKHRPAQEEATEQSKQIFGIKDRSVKSISIDNKKVVFHFECQDLSLKLCKPSQNSKWEITEPSKLRAEDSNVNGLLSTLNQLSSSELIDLTPETPEKRLSLLKDYGLDAESRKNAKKVQIEAEGEKITLYLGHAHPIGEGIFALREKEKVDENRVFIIPTHFSKNLENGLTHWRDKKLFAAGTHDIEKVEIEGSHSKIIASKVSGKNDEWNLSVKNQQMPGDLDAMNSLLSSLIYINAKEFVADQKNSPQGKKILAGLKPSVRISFQKEKGTEKEAPAPITLTLYSKKSGADEILYATTSHLDPVFEVDKSAKARLDKNIKELRLNKLITSIERFSISKLELSGAEIGSKPIVIHQKDGKWIRQSDQAELKKEKVQEVIDRLSGNRIKDFIDGSSIPEGEKSGLKITLGDDKKEALRQYVFWKNGANLYGHDLLSPRKEALKIDSSILGVLPWSADYFKDAEVKHE